MSSACDSCPSKNGCTSQDSCPSRNQKTNPNIKRVIGVASGKGGVGKSTVSAFKFACNCRSVIGGRYGLTY